MRAQVSCAATRMLLPHSRDCTPATTWTRWEKNVATAMVPIETLQAPAGSVSAPDGPVQGTWVNDWQLQWPGQAQATACASQARHPPTTGGGHGKGSSVGAALCSPRQRCHIVCFRACRGMGMGVSQRCARQPLTLPGPASGLPRHCGAAGRTVVKGQPWCVRHVHQASLVGDHARMDCRGAEAGIKGERSGAPHLATPSGRAAGAAVDGGGGAVDADQVLLRVRGVACDDCQWGEQGEAGGGGAWRCMHGGGAGGAAGGRQYPQLDASRNAADPKPTRPHAGQASARCAPCAQLARHNSASASRGPEAIWGQSTQATAAGGAEAPRAPGLCALGGCAHGLSKRAVCSAGKKGWACDRTGFGSHRWGDPARRWHSGLDAMAPAPLVAPCHWSLPHACTPACMPSPFGCCSSLADDGSAGVLARAACVLAVRPPSWVTCTPPLTHCPGPGGCLCSAQTPTALPHVP